MAPIAFIARQGQIDLWKRHLIVERYRAWMGHRQSVQSHSAETYVERSTSGRIYWQVSLFAGMLSAASMPLYIHLPVFATTELGLSLSTVGAVLIGVRVLDFIQDPVLGHMVDYSPELRHLFAAVSMIGLAAGFLMLFAVPPVGNVVVWLSAALVLVFSSFSLATILFYGQGVTLAGKDDPAEHYRLAGFRETGALAGVVLAALAPTALASVDEANSYRDFGFLLAALAVLVWFFTRKLWEKAPVRSGSRGIPLAGLRASAVPKMILLALLNTLPVAITSTLFLFFVTDRLGLKQYAGAFLLLFFVAAGATAPFWPEMVRRFGTKKVLVPAMMLAVLSFVWVAVVPTGAGLTFGVICVASGAALGADMVILPALFATVLAKEDLPAGIGFGLWAFATKLGLALAAAVVLPALQFGGYVPGAENGARAIGTLTIAYAAVPCGLKLLAIAMVLRLPETEGAT